MPYRPIKQWLFCLPLITTLFSCSQMEEKLAENSLTFFKIDVSDARALPYYSAFDSLSFIRLETNKESVLGWITKIIFTTNRLYIKANGQEEIYIFSRTGKYLRKIAKKGKGPGEYNEITSFAVDPASGKVLVSAPNKLITYDRNGNFVAERKEKAAGFDLIINNKNYIYSFNRHMNKNKAYEGYNIVIKDARGNLLDKGVQIEPYLKNFVTGDNVFSKFKGTVTYSLPYTDTIYHINEAGINPVYLFDFGDRRIPYEEEFKGFMKQNPMERLNKLNGLNLKYAVKNSCVENSAFIYFNYAFSKTSYGGIINKKTSGQLIFDKIVNEDFIIGNPSIIGFDGDRLVSVINSHDLKEQSGKLDDTKNDDLQILRKMVGNITANDNPVILYHHLRDEWK